MKRLTGVKLSAGRRYLAFAASAAGLLAFLVTACASPAAHVPSAATSGFAGYQWSVVSIGHAGRTTPIPARYRVYLQFTPSGQFLANDPVNSHSGTYTVTPGGFTTDELASTVVGYIGTDPVEVLAIDAISALGEKAHALTKIHGDTLTVTVNGYTLTAQRDGVQANWPAPPHT